MIRKGFVLTCFFMIFISSCVWAKEDNRDNSRTAIGAEDTEILTLDDFSFDDGERALRKGGYEDIDFDEMLHQISEGDFSYVIQTICQGIYQRTIGDIALVEQALGNLLLIAILSAFFTNFANVFSGENVSGTGFYVCYLVVITLMVTLFESFCVLATDFVHLLLEFVGGIIPAYFLSIAVIGQASAAGFYQLVLVIIGVVEFVFLKVSIPLIKVYMAISLMNNVSREDFLSGSTKLIKNIVLFLNKSMLGIVTGIHIIQGLVLPAADSAKNITVRKVVGALPVVGDSTDAMSGIILGSVNLIKNTIGAFSMIMIVVICMVPLIKLQLYSASMQLVTALIQPVADERMIKSFECMHQGIKLLARVVISAALLFIICIAIICIMTKI